MSGGVDSSVTAALLKKRGFKVVGAFMKCWDEVNQFGECTSAEDAEMARQTAQVIGIPFYSFDFTKEYRQEVFNYFISEYKAGRTPNPDVVCNREIKFGIFLKKALALGFEYIATGHYVRLKIQNLKHKIKKTKQKNVIYKLYQAKDKNKDQSYFLWQLTQEQLRHSIFPIGDYTKDQVRKMARNFGLPNAERKDSQGICFMGKIKLEDFLRQYIQEKTGNIIDAETGKILGKHPGVFFFTIGQRKGIRLPGGPYWVVEKRIEDNVLVVSKDIKDLYKKEVIVTDVNWISGQEPRFPLSCSAVIRYHHPPAPAKIYKLEDGKYKVKFHHRQQAIAPGQSIVFYQGQEMLGGGIMN